MNTKQAKPTVLAVGAAGHFAGMVIPELKKRGVPVRGLVREAKHRDQALSRGATEVAIGDLSNPEAVAEALKGIETAFYIAPAFVPNEAQIGTQFVAAAADAGVRRIVFSSVIHPTLGALENHRDKAPVEQALFESGLEYVILQPAMFFQNFEQSWSKVVSSGTHAEPWSAKSRFTRVDYRDVAEVAANGLLEDSLLYGTFELCAEGNLDRHEVAALMSKVLGRGISVDTINPDETAQAADKSQDSREAGPMQKMMSWYDKHDLRGNATTLRAILGREPRTLQHYFEELQKMAVAA